MNIKIRLWDAIAKKYVYDPEIVLECLKQQTIGIYDHIADGCAFEQFTGCKDVEGIEIYAGDKVEKYRHIFKNIYDNHSMGFVDTETEFEGFIYGVVRFLPSLGFTIKQTHSIDLNSELELKLKGYTPIVSSRVKVIGNIHK